MDIQKENVGFGDFCSIEQKRYGAPNEFYGYKVVNRLRSNSWISVPVDARDQKPKRHDEVFDVVEVISLTAGCDVIERFRVVDLARAWKANDQAVPEWISVEDGLPSEEQDILFYLDMDDVILDGYYSGSTFIAAHSTHLRSDVSHWMYHPLPPKAQEPNHE